MRASQGYFVNTSKLGNKREYFQRFFEAHLRLPALRRATYIDLNNKVSDCHHLMVDKTIYLVVGNF